MTEPNEILGALRRQLSAGQLPGADAQREMSIANRPGIPVPDRSLTRNAAVLVALYPASDTLNIVFMQRKVSPNDRHSGQISFPGGKQERGESLLETALRESHEEVGTPTTGIDILGQLSMLFVPVSNFDIYPFVGFIDYRPDFTPEQGEVESILEVPVDHLLRPDTRKHRSLRLHSGIVLRDVPYFEFEGYVIWGATAMILNELLTIIRKAA